MSRYQKGKTNLDFTEARVSEWQWHQLGHMQVCTLLQTDNHASTPPPVVNTEEEKERLWWEGFALKEGFKPGMRVTGISVSMCCLQCLDTIG